MKGCSGMRNLQRFRILKSHLLVHEVKQLGVDRSLLSIKHKLLGDLGLGLGLAAFKVQGLVSLSRTSKEDLGLRLIVRNKRFVFRVS